MDHAVHFVTFYRLLYPLSVLRYMLYVCVSKRNVYTVLNKSTEQQKVRIITEVWKGCYQHLHLPRLSE